MQQCITIYFIFIKSSTCFGRHTAHHQEPKTALAASGFVYVEGCWMCSCWTLLDFLCELFCCSLGIIWYVEVVGVRNKDAGRCRPATTCPTTFHV